MRSHVNQTTFVQYLYVRPGESDLDVADLLQDRRDTQSLGSALQRQLSSTPLLFFHETYHYWQGLRLPFLYRFAVLSHRLIWQAYGALAKQGQPLGARTILLPELHRLALHERISWFDHGPVSYLVYRPDPTASAGATASWEVSPQDLLETAASVSEFQVTNDQETRQDPIAFQRWCKRHPAYLDAYLIVSTVLGPRTALMAVVPIVNAAFATTDPVRALASLIHRGQSGPVVCADAAFWVAGVPLSRVALRGGSPGGARSWMDG